MKRGIITINNGVVGIPTASVCRKKRLPICSMSMGVIFIEPSMPFIRMVYCRNLERYNTSDLMNLRSIDAYSIEIIIAVR